MPDPGPEHATCWTVVQRASTGDQSAANLFVSTYFPFVLAFLRARWAGTPLRDETEDAVQEVFIEFFRTNGPLSRVDRERDGGFRAFLYGVVRIVALRYERKAGREIPTEDAGALADQDSSLQEEWPSRHFERAWAQSILRATVERLEERAGREGAQAVRRAEILRLRFRDGLPIREIATRMGVDASVLHHEYARAREEFRSAMEAEVAFHAPGTAADIERECHRILDLIA